MARKKKKVNNSNTIQYTGKVKVEYFIGDKLQKSKEYHNTGCIPLFSFLGDCLTGTLVADNLPRFIRLFLVDASDEGSYDNQVTATAIPCSTIYKEDSLNPDKTQVNYKFIVPFSYLSAGEEANKIAIYSTRNRGEGNKANPSAYFILKNGSSYDPIVGDGKTNLVLTWTMTISNPPSGN